jgi:hypothetical protein
MIQNDYNIASAFKFDGENAIMSIDIYISQHYVIYSDR